MINLITNWWNTDECDHNYTIISRLPTTRSHPVEYIFTHRCSICGATYMSTNFDADTYDHTPVFKKLT